MEPCSLAEVCDHVFTIISRKFANNFSLQSSPAPQGVMWSFAATCDVIDPCMQVGARLVFPRLICRLCPEITKAAVAVLSMEYGCFYEVL